MTGEDTARFIEVQERISARLEELAFADRGAATRIGHHLAEIMVLSQDFTEQTLPLFLSLDRENHPMLASVVTSAKCDLEQIGDAIADVHEDLLSLMAFLRERASTM